VFYSEIAGSLKMAGFSEGKIFKMRMFLEFWKFYRIFHKIYTIFLMSGKDAVLGTKLLYKN